MAPPASLVQQHPGADRDCAAFQPSSFAFLIILALKHEAVGLISSPSPGAASLLPQVIPAHAPPALRISLLQPALLWTLHHFISLFRDDFPWQRLCCSHRSSRSSELLPRCEVAAAGAEHSQGSPWQGNAGEILERLLCRTAPNSTNCIWISSGCFFHFEQEFTGTESSILPSCLLQGHFHHEKQSPVLLPDIFIMNVLSGSWSDTDLSRDVSLDLSSLPAPVGIFPSPLSQLTWPSCG